MRADEGGFVVRVEDGNGALQDDGAVVDSFVDEVNGAAGDFRTVVERLLLGVETGEGGQQRRMDVEDALRKGSDEGGGKDAHVAGEDDPVDAGGAEVGDHVGVVELARCALRDLQGGGKAQVAGRLQAGCGGDVRKDERDFALRECAGCDGLVDGEEVGAAAAEEDAEAMFALIACGCRAAHRY